MKFICLGLLLSVFTARLYATPRLAIFGDRYATGAAASSQYQLDFVTVWQQLEAPPTHTLSQADQKTLAQHGFPPPFLPPRTLWFSKNEFVSGIDWGVKFLVHGLSHLYYNQDACSWGALLGKKKNLSADQILLAAHLGDSIVHFPAQVERMLEATGGELPPNILIWFPIEDLCHIPLSASPSKNIYRAALRRGLELLATKGKPSSQGARIWVVSPLKATQLLLSPSIQEKSVYAFGTTTTCKQLREKNFHPGPLPVLTQAPPMAAYLADIIPPNPARICPSFFAQTLLAQNEMSIFTSENKRKKEIESKIEAATGNLSQAIREYRSEGKREVETLQTEWMKKKRPLTLQWITAVEDLQLEAADVAADCFHLSLAGHIKVALLLEKALSW